MACNYPGNIRELKKLCKKLSIEKGAAIFAKKESDIGIETGIFDYERFRHEYSLWEKYITPILLEHNLNFKYKFFPIPTLPEVKKKEELSVGTLIRRDVFAATHPDYVEPRKPDPSKGMADLVRKLQIEKGEEKLIKSFTDLLNSCLRDGKLDVLLNGIDRYIEHNDQPQRFKPNLIALLDLNFEEAKEKFKSEYLNYHLQNHNQNRKETAEALGMKEKTLESAISRLRAVLKTAPKNKLNSPNS
jgi:DNA-binding NtrC family response regulator